MQEIARGLSFPEGPVALDDGALLVVEIAGGRLTRIAPDGMTSTVAQLGGGPNGAALGPDGRCYVCNNGGFAWRERNGVRLPVGPAQDYAGGSIQAVDLVTGKVERLYERCGEQLLRGPNDLVFDRGGGFWFTDHGHVRGRVRDRGAVYYARPDGSSIVEAIFPVETPNGIALSPDERTLYVAETMTGRLWAWSLDGPGRIAQRGRNLLGGTGHLVYGAGGFHLFDSMAVDADGNIFVGSVPGAILVISPQGELVQRIPMPEHYATNLCFGGPDLTTLYVTLSSTGRVIAFTGPWRGMKPNFS